MQGLPDKVKGNPCRLVNSDSTPELTAGRTNMASLEFKNVTKRFGSTTVIENMNLIIEDGSFTVLIGPSGCGKTTLLRMIAGIGLQTSGKVLLDGKDISDLPPGKRDVAMVFQNYAIYPTMSVRENIEYGLKNNKVPLEERKRRIEEICETVDITPYMTRKPGTLSGGQRQRVALARAMVKHPKVFLMDEPLSNLDAKLRVQMRTELIELHLKLKTTFVYVTHDQVEAMSMADRIILINNGVIQQSDNPHNIYYNPVNRFTAQFIGSPQMNIMKVPGTEGEFGFRPEKVSLSDHKVDGFYFGKARIITREMLGSETIYQLRTDNQTIMVKSLADHYEPDSEIFFSVNKNDILIFDENQNRVYEHDIKYSDIIIKARGA
jgi:sn-glycerol 3-phosphate transport system ATP-binding protein